MTVKNLEQTIIAKIDSAKVKTQEKLFKAFVATTDQRERDEIGAKMNVLNNVVINLKKAIRDGIE